MKRSIAYGWFIVTMLLTGAPTALGQQGDPHNFTSIAMAVVRN